LICGRDSRHHLRPSAMTRTAAWQTERNTRDPNAARPLRQAWEWNRRTDRQTDGWRPAVTVAT